MIGASPGFAKLRTDVARWGASEAPVLISGETGSGKEVVAKALHGSSRRRDAPFIAINCAALPRELVESELFGHCKGAFTGALADRTGLLEAADRGTLMLDEVDSLPLDVQPKLLRVLQELEFRRVGEMRRRRCDVRFLAACNRDLARLVEAGAFRADLYFRLSVVILRVPPLRDRSDDVPLLAEYFLTKFSNVYGSAPPRLSSGAIEHLQRQAWPGNVRQLENCIHRAFLLGSEGTIRPCDLTLPEDQTPVHSFTSVSESEAQTFHILKKQLVDSFEREYLEKILSAHGGNVTLASRNAGLDRRSFQRLMQKHGLRRS